MQATLLTLAIAAILALLAALFGPYFVDWNAQRATFEQQASQAIGLPVRVSGTMDVRLLPSPSLVLSGIEIGQPGDPQTLRAKALGIEFALPPLLSGKLRAVEMRLIAPEMRVSLTPDGQALLPNALAGIDTQALSIDKFVVEDATVLFTDAASGTSAALNKLWFTGEVRALPGPIRGEGAFVMDGALFGYRIATARPEANGSRIKLVIDPADRPVSAEAEGVLTATGGVPRFDGTAIIARRVPLKGDKGDIAEPWRITARVKANAASALFEQVEYQYGPEERALKLQGTAEARFGAHPRLDAVLSARTLDADKLLGGGDAAGQAPRGALAALVAAAERIIGPPIPTQVGFGIDSLTLGGASLQNIRGDVEFDRGQMILTGFEVRAPGFTQIQASGRIDKADDRLAFAGPVSVTSTDPRAFAEWLDGKPGASLLPARPLRFRGDVTIGTDKIAIAGMQAEFDRKSVDGDLSYVFAKDSEPPRLAASLRADEFDLDGWIDAAGSLRFPINVDRPGDASLALAFKRLRFRGIDGDGVDVRLTMKAGKLTIDRLAVESIGGIALDSKGSVDVEARRGSVAFGVTLRDPQQLAALAKTAPASVSETLQRVAQSATPGKLAGKVTVEPAGNSGDSRLTLTLEGPLGGVDVRLNSVLAGQWTEPDKANVTLDGVLNSGDVNALLRLVAAERVVSVPKQPGTITFSMKGALAGDVAIDTRIVSANLDMRANGTVRPLGPEAGQGSMDVTIGTADVVLPGAAAAIPVALKTRLVRDGSGMRLDDMSATIAGSTVRGRLGLVFSDPFGIDGELRTDRVDLAAVAATAFGAKRAAKSDALWSETPFAVPALPKLSGRVNVSAAQAALTPSLQASKFRSMLRFDDAQLVVENIAGEVLGGQVSGEITIRRAPDAIGLQGRIALADADATQLLFGDGAAPLTGQAALSVQFEGLGRSPRALVGSLNGSGTLTLEHARIASLDPRVFATAIAKVDQGLPVDAPRVRELASSALDAGPLVVPQAQAGLTIAAGVARIDTFKARAETADLAVSGSYDFSNSRIDLRMAMTGPADGTTLQPEIAVQLRGPSSAPQRSLDVSALTGWLALHSVERQTKRIEAIEQGRAVEQAPPPPQKEAEPQKPEARVTPPERRKPPALQPAQPLPPAVEIRPAPGERRRILPQPREPRIESQRIEPQRPATANPFPTPIGSPPQQRPSPPQGVRPVF
ncbi:AsmA-like C-terminal region-containing protein [Pseudorhodoplanes sp.]|uniref:AsmA family protein n=1 Tax=Pseudorhodoplanes sp. TaxID=1934341 RepID=UPI002BABBC6A|nr:AsmA-like C-terminal region-containing protein [Pseudorhodoplanes sp.]HWV40418.1 AsmA-like C-terminal region-containing protein [Pseudorhodoplanes sp.]